MTPRLFLLLLALPALAQDPPAPDWSLLGRQLPLLASNDPEERLAARTVLQAPAISKEVLVHHLAEASHQKAAAVALCVRGDEQGREIVTRLLAGPAVSDQVLAIEALRSFAPDAPLLGKLLDSESFPLALASARALAACEEDPGVQAAVSAQSERVGTGDASRRRPGLLSEYLIDAPNVLSRVSWFVKSGEAPVADLVLLLFQHEVPVGHAELADFLRACVKRADLPAATTEMAALALLRSSILAMDDFVLTWGSKVPKVRELLKKRFESIGLQPERIEEWTRLLAAGGLPKDLEKRVLEWLAGLTGIKPSKSRDKDLAAWKNWYESRKKGLKDAKADAAIDRGVAWLKQHALRGDSEHVRGLNALEAYALLKSGVMPGDPLLDAKIASLRKSSPVETYDAALRVMLFSALRAEDGSPGAPVRTGTATEEDLDPDLLALRASAAWLLRAQQQNGAWSYSRVETSDVHGEIRFDHSNTQFALLGLRAAVNSGVQVPPEVWKRAEQHLLGMLKAGDRDGRGAPAGGDVVTGPPEKGWGYGENREPDEPYWNMTCGGVTALLVCRASLSGKQPSDHVRDADVVSAFRWLDRRYMLTPSRPIQSLPDLDLYGLWSMERACLTAGMDKLARHDWYAEGAELLLHLQLADGSWTGGDIHINAGPRYASTPTCLALLFLRRAYVPVVTRPARWTPTGTPSPSPEPEK